MTVLIPYLIKLSISLAVVYLFYHLFLRRLTFYNWNRWYLLIYSFLSFFIPFINIYPVLEKNNWDNSGMLELIPVVSYQVNSISLPIEETSIPWTYQDWTMLLIGIGAVIMLGRLFIQQLSFIRIRRSSTLLLNDRIKVYQVNKNIIPFSYGNSIFVNQHQHSQEELKEIIRHEFIHVKQKHTLDILWAELLCIFNWYNPFAWLIRKSIRQNLEFIADNKVLQNGIDKKEYQYLLLKVIGVSQFSVATQFNFSSLKKRIAMMNKIKSAKVHLLKFLFMLPLMAVLLLSFRNNFYKNGDKTVYWVSGIVLDQSTNLPLNDVLISEMNSGKKTYTDKQGYFKLQLPYEGTNINFAVSFDIPGYKPAKRGMRSSEFQFENNNGNIEFIYLAKASGPRTHSEYYHGEPDYSIVRKRFNDHIAIGERDKRIDALVGNSTKPIWIIDGIPYVVGYGLKAWFDKEEIEASPEFKISVDGKLMTMEEANTNINRSEIVGVAAYGVETSQKELGVAMNVFVLYLDKPVKDNKVDTTPTKRKLPSNVSSISVKNDIATVKLKNGNIETYDLNKEDELEKFEKKYGKMPAPPTPPAPPLAPTPRTEEHVRVEQKENSKGYIVTVADNNGECVVIIKDKDKKIVKAMLLTEWNDHEFENAAKYGEIPSPTPAKEAIPVIPVPAAPSARAKVNGVEVAPVPANPTVPPTNGRVNGVEIVPVPARPKVPPPGFDDGIIVAPSPEKFYIKPPKPVPHTFKPSVQFRNINSTLNDPLFIIDGVKQTLGKEVLYTINPNDIESISVHKDGAGKVLFGKKANGGVVSIKTKKGQGNQPWNLDHIQNFEGLIILDGDEVNREQLNERVKSEDIESVNVLSKEEATKNYGEKGKKGVMFIRTKAKKDPTIVTGGQAGQSLSSKSAAPINRTVAGIIIDQETRKPIAGVKVYSTELGFETTTDKNGYYFVHINKQPTVLPRILMTHPQYLSAMAFDGSFDKQKDIDHTLVLFMGMHKGNPNSTKEFTTSSMAQQYTLTTNKTPGYEQVNEILTQWLEKYDHQRDRAHAEEYIDRVDVNEGIMNWTLVKNSKKHPLVLLEKRIIGKDLNAVEKQVKMSDMYEFEFIAHGDLLKQYGDDAKDGIMNIITKANKDNQAVRLVPKKKISEEELTAMLAEASKLNVLYVGIENPLKIQVENIPANELEIRLEGGLVYQRNGVFYAIPQDNEGGNSKIDIYKKLKNGQTQLLNSRYFRVRSLPQQNNSLLVSL